MMLSRSYYFNGKNLDFIKDDYNLDYNYTKYILRGYSDMKDNEGKYYFSLEYKNNEGYYLKPDNKKEDELLLSLLDHINIPYEIDISDDQEVLYVYRDCNLIDFMHTIFSEKLPFSTDSDDLFEEFIYNYDTYRTSVDFQYTLNDENAVPPSKSRYSDTGYDLTIIKEKKKIGKTTIYDTGVSIKPPFGYYYDVVPRSSISKLGYIQTNSVGIIDSGYRGNIMIALTKIDDSQPDLELPMRIGQVIPRKLELVNMKQVTQLDNSNRMNDGGINR